MAVVKVSDSVPMESVAVDSSSAPIARRPTKVAPIEKAGAKG